MTVYWKATLAGCALGVVGLMACAPHAAANADPPRQRFQIVYDQQEAYGAFRQPNMTVIVDTQSGECFVRAAYDRGAGLALVPRSVCEAGR